MCARTFRPGAAADTNGRMRKLKTDVAVIGAGTAGVNARAQVERAGKDWLLIEAGAYGTMCARTGCFEVAASAISDCPSA